MTTLDGIMIIVFLLIELACIFYFFPKIYYYLSGKLSINFFMAWERFILINVILMMISPIITGIMVANNIETTIHTYVSTLTTAPYLSIIHIINSVCLVYIYAGKRCKTKKASRTGAILTGLGLASCWLSIILILKIINPPPTTNPLMIFDLYFFFNCIVALIEAFSWFDFYSGEFRYTLNTDKIKKLLKKGDELFNEISEIRKFITNSDSMKPLGKKTISIKMITIDEAYQFAYEWVSKKSIIVFWNKPKVILARRCFITIGGYQSFTENILPTFIYIKIIEGYGQVDVDVSLFPLKKWIRRKKILEEKTLKILNEI